MWFWLAVTAGIASALEKVINRISLRDRGNIIAFSFIYFSLMAIFSFWFSLPLKINPTGGLFILLTTQALFWSLGSLFSFWSQTNTDVSLSMIISRARILWMIPLGVIFLNQYPNTYSIVGMLIIFFGLATLLVKENIHKYRGVQSMTLGSIFVAIGSIFNVILVQNYLTPAQVTFVTMLSQSVIFLIILIVRKNIKVRLTEIIKRAWYLILLASIIETYAFIGINLAFKTGLASAVTAIYLSMTVVTIWIGIIFLKERKYFWRKIVSSAIVTVGIIIVKMFS
jgi:drug/metabolite transporter (DMT)-like permease